MTSFTGAFGGGDIIKTADLVTSGPQERTIQRAEMAPGFNEETDPPRIKILLTPDGENGNVLFGNNSIRVALLRAIEDDVLPDDMDKWGGAVIHLFVGPVRTPSGSVTARQIKVLKSPPNGGASLPVEDEEIPF